MESNTELHISTDDLTLECPHCGDNQEYLYIRRESLNPIECTSCGDLFNLEINITAF